MCQRPASVWGWSDQAEDSESALASQRSQDQVRMKWGENFQRNPSSRQYPLCDVCTNEINTTWHKAGIPHVEAGVTLSAAISSHSQRVCEIHHHWYIKVNSSPAMRQQVQIYFSNVLILRRIFPQHTLLLQHQSLAPSANLLQIILLVSWLPLQ